MSDHKYYDDKGNVIASLDASYPFTTDMTLDSNNTLTNPLDVPTLHGTWTIKDGEYNGQMYAIGKAEFEPTIQFNFQQGEVLRIEQDGRIYWKGREVESDDEFKAAMMELRDVMINSMGGRR